jgi:hypothetical protein
MTLPKGLKVVGLFALGSFVGAILIYGTFSQGPLSMEVAPTGKAAEVCVGIFPPFPFPALCSNAKD